MPPKYIHGLVKVKKTKQTLLPSTCPPTNDVVPVIPTYLDPILRCTALEPLKPTEPKQYT